MVEDKILKRIVLLGTAIVLLVFGYSHVSFKKSPPSVPRESPSNASITYSDELPPSVIAHIREGGHEVGGTIAGRWRYSENMDTLRGKTTYYASLTSSNFIAQAPPYDGETTMQITVRRAPGLGTDVIMQISQGQMMCPSYEGCSGTVRFDDGPVERIRFNGPSDNSNETVFVVNVKRFIDKLKESNRLVVEKTLYQAGNPQFEFDVSALKWEH